MPVVAAGVGRTLTVLVATYAILRRQLLGIDLTVKWTVRQSTVAAAFVGVFFVVSESASNFFAQSTNSPYFGIAAAGMLVFAIAPLQRAAERVASAAIPGVRAPAEMTPSDRAAFYRERVALAWADGRISEAEQRMLARQRERLGLSETQALELERAVVQERLAAPGAG